MQSFVSFTDVLAFLEKNHHYETHGMIIQEKAKISIFDTKNEGLFILAH